MILLSGKAKTHDKPVGTDLGSFAGRRPSAKEGASPKREFICINDRLSTFLTRHGSKMAFVQRSHTIRREFMHHSAAVNLSNVCFSWSKDRSIAPIITLPNWQVAQGERVFLQGQSGSGKSTLLTMLSGILLPDQGSIRILGTEITELSHHQRDRFRAQHLGVIFQQFNLIPYLSVSDNIRLSQTFSGIKPQADRIIELCEQLDLDKTLLKQQAKQLSVGQQQRVAVARALYHRPKLIIADEPTSALDTDTRDDFIRLLLKQSQQTNSAVIFVSHDKSIASHFDRVDDLSLINQKKSEVDHAI
jgi:putative ABC transport system ATP-binding protein